MQDAKVQAAIERVRGLIGSENFDHLMHITQLEDYELAAAYLASSHKERGEVKSMEDLMTLLGRKHAENLVTLILMQAGLEPEEAVQIVRQAAAEHYAEEAANA